MQLTKKTDYCFRVLITLQRLNKKIKIKDLADKLSIPKNHLSVIVNKLSELKYINSTQGPHGGICFNIEAKDKSLYELLFHFENIDIVECFNAKTNTCNLSPDCKLRHILMKSNHAFINEFSKYKVKDLI